MHHLRNAAAALLLALGLAAGASAEACPAESGASACRAGAGDEAVLLQLRAGKEAALPKQANGRIPVWIWWDYESATVSNYGSGMPGFFEACVASWKRYAPSDLYEIHYVNQSNIRDFLPDFPEETKRMYVAAVTDMIRTGLLAKHGGVYFDADFILAHPLQDITDRLKEVDFVAYSNDGQDCRRSATFSSNFMAARKGNLLSMRWYDTQKADLQRRCQPGEIYYQPTCCYTPEGEARECHVPWGHLGEGNGHRILGELLRANSTLNFHCYSEDDDHAGFAPYEMEGMWAALAGEADEPPMTKWKCEASGNDLLCTDNGGKRRKRVNFFCRRAYHLFSTECSPAIKRQSYSILKKKPWVFSKLLRMLEGDEERHCELS